MFSAFSRNKDAIKPENFKLNEVEWYFALRFYGKSVFLCLVKLQILF